MFSARLDIFRSCTLLIVTAERMLLNYVGFRHIRPDPGPCQSEEVPTFPW